MATIESGSEFNPIPQWQYKVSPGDTIYSIARKFKINGNVLMALNGLKNPEDLQEGSTIAIRDINKQAHLSLLTRERELTRQEMASIKHNILLLRKETENQINTIVENITRPLLRSESPLTKQVQINIFLQTYFEEKKDILSSEVKGRVLLYLAKKRLLTNEPFRYFDQIKECSALKDILISTVRPGGLISNVGGFQVPNSEYVFQNFSLYRNFPWAGNVLAETLKFDTEEVFNRRLHLNNIVLDDEQEHCVEEAKRRFVGLRSFVIQMIGPQATTSDQEELDNLLCDNALENVADIRNEWLVNAITHTPGYEEFFQSQSVSVDSPGFLNFKIMVTRNLFFADKKNITENTVTSETERIIGLWTKYKDTPLFSGRNILYLAHGERVGQHDPRFSFGKNAYLNSILAQRGRLVPLSRPANDTELLDTNAEASVAFIDTPRPFTFIFDGHGTSDTMHILDSSSGYARITDEQFFHKCLRRNQARDRIQGEISDFSERDWIINNSCFGSDQVRSILARFVRHNAQESPLFISPAEYGQTIQYNPVDPAINPFMRGLFLENSPTSPTTFKHLIQANLQGRYNPSIYTIIDGKICQLL